MKIKKILLIGLLIIAILSNITFVYASDSFSVTLITDKQIYAPGETVIVTVKLSNVNSEKGIYGMVGNLAYKTDVFEEITSDSNGYTNSVTALNGWGNLTYNSSDKSFSISSTTPAKSTQQIMQIALKIKEGAPSGTTVIMLNNLVGSNSDSDIVTSTASVSITIQEKQTQQIPEVTATATPTATPTATSTPASSKLPQTGIDDTIKIVLVSSAVIAVISYFAYIRYKGI